MISSKEAAALPEALPAAIITIGQRPDSTIETRKREKGDTGDVGKKVNGWRKLEAKVTRRPAEVFDAGRRLCATPTVTDTARAIGSL